MHSNRHVYWIPFVSISICTFTMAGCGSSSPTKNSSEPNANVVRGEHSHGPGEHSHEAEEHTHEPGAHGGLIVPIGSDSYHAEAVIEKNGDFRLFMLGKDESKIMEVDIQPINAYVKAIGGADATPMEMKAVPQDGDGPDKTSQFVGQLPEPLRGQPLEVTIPNLKIAGERFRIGFTTVTETHDEQMPDGISKDEEKQLLLTPGGHYTEADIQANGGVTATVKFKGIPPAHDSKPKPGDRLCPITMTKANPKFTWVVGGKPYQFCCPPCIEEFVKNAKESPDPLQDPESYVKPQDDSK